MVDLLKLQSVFAELSPSKPRLFSAPGRVNLIGEHTDYNEGFVLPMAANLRTYVAAGERKDRKIVVHSGDLNETAEFSLDDKVSSSQTGSSGWINYIQGITHFLCAAGLDCEGANLAIASDVPIGAGLSSSAALEVAVGFALAEITKMKISRLELARLAQEAEHVFVGTKSGLMDQLTATLAQENHAMLIDCRSFQVTQIPMSLPGTAVVICDTRMKHELVSSGYNQRREECDSSLRLLQNQRPDVRALRDLTLDDFDLVTSLPEPERRRARHVITENQRTLAAAHSLGAGDAGALGQLMKESHKSLRDDFEVSCLELDIMCDLAQGLEGVSGARMMGGGFGGCTINLVARDQLEEFTDGMSLGYQQATGLVPVIHVVQPDEGVGELFV